MDELHQTKTIDWFQIGLHTIIAAGVGVIAAFWGGWWLVGLCSIVFFLREVLQRIERGDPLLRVFYSHQVILEWVGPSAAVVAAFLLVRVLGWA